MDLDRYIKQVRFGPLGQAGQERLLAGRALICGCGALGSVHATLLARAGVGHLRLVDRDFLEITNLQRQVLYDEEDLATGLPKAIAAQRRLQRINSTIEIEAEVADVDYRNIARLLEGVDVILDGTDNFETRFLLNDAAIHFRIPWVYGGCLGSEGQTMTIVPDASACLRCLIPEPPPPGATPTCDTAGVLGPVISVVAAIQACEALKILAGQTDAVNRNLTVVDVWESRFREVALDGLREGQDCPACQQRDLAWLRGERGSQSAVLCGRHAVQLSFPEKSSVPLAEVARKLEGIGPLQANAYLVRCRVEGFQITVFADGRAIVGGTEDIGQARAVYARYVGI